MHKTDPAGDLNSLRRVLANKKCFDCAQSGTTYVVTEFGIFVCSRCAGIHREFSHRAKGLSMCTFGREEVEALKGGNEAAAKRWHHRVTAKDFPDTNQPLMVKDFIRQTFVEKRFFLSEGKNEAPEVQAPATNSWAAFEEAKKPISHKPPSEGLLGDLMFGVEEPLKFAAPKAEPKKTTEQASPSPALLNLFPPQPPSPVTNVPVSTSPVQPHPIQSFSTNPPNYSPTLPQVQLNPHFASTSLAAVWKQGAAEDPFLGLGQEEIQRQKPKPQPMANHQQMLLQQYMMQAQLYAQMNGAQYPYNFQTWLQILSLTPPQAEPQRPEPIRQPEPLRAVRPEPLRPVATNPFDSL